MIHIPLVLTAAAIPLAGHPLLYLPIHIVWLELIIHPTALLVFQDMSTNDALPQRQRDGPARFFTPRSWAAIAAAGLILAALIYFGFERALGAADDVAHARALAFSALIAISAASTAALSGLRGWSARIAVVASLGSVGLFVQVRALAHLLEMTPLHGHDWVLVVVAGMVAGALALAAKASLIERAATV